MTERATETHTPELREERKVVTALFADLVGSTALAERLDAEEVKLVVSEAVARIVTEVQKLGGHVKDLAGDGVLAFFGAPVSYEDDAERAVRTGLQIVRELGAYGREVEQGFGVEGFSVRVGICTGPVVLGALGAGERVEYAAFGDTVNTAARIQTAAQPGSVLVDETTHRLVAQLFDWAEPTELELKGKAEPVGAYAVLRPLPFASKPRGLEGVETGLVGRDAELAAAWERAEGVLQGAGGIIFVTGEAGIGKTRLTMELRSRVEGAKPEGARPLWIEGRCVSYGESLPLLPFRDLLRDWLGVAVDEPELRVRVALRRSVERFFGDRTLEIYPYLGSVLGLSLEPDAAARLVELSPEALQYRSFEVIRTLLERLSQDGPVVAAIEDVHWADATSVQLSEQLLSLAEDAAVLLVLTQRDERDHLSWRVKELAAREFPHLTREIALEPLTGNADRELLDALVGEDTIPKELASRILADAEGNPFYLEELVRSLADSGALVREGESWRFEHDVQVEIPPTVERVILARIDRLAPACHEVLTAAAVLGRRFTLPLLEGISGGDGEVHDALHELQRLDLVRTARRWPQPEYRFKHSLIQEAAYRTLVGAKRTALHRKAAEWLERHHADNVDEVLGLLAHHWLEAEDEDKAVTYLARAGDNARQEYALDEAIGCYRDLLPLLDQRGAQHDMALVLLKLALALHTSLRFGEANAAYQRAFDLWRPPAAHPHPTATLRLATSFLPNDPDPKSAMAWPNIQLCMQLFDRLVEAWPERTIVPSLAERWEISGDGLRYVFHLREGLTWSDGEPLTAHDVEYGIKRVLDPESPGSSVAIYFVLENGQDYYLGRNRDAERIGVRALDDRTVEFRLAAPAPYFMSVMNRPDGGPQPRHAIEEHGETWIQPERQVVSGAFQQTERTEKRLVLERRERYNVPRTGNVARVDSHQSPLRETLAAYELDEFDLGAVRYTPRMADLVPSLETNARFGPVGWSIYLSFDHSDPGAGNVGFRRALAHAIDRRTLTECSPANLLVATGGIVPPALQGHTPDIVLRFDPDLAREYLARSGVQGPIRISALDEWDALWSGLAESWREVLAREVEVRTWTWEEVTKGAVNPEELAPISFSGWLPGYPDPEYFLRLLLHSDSKTNEGGFAYPPFDELIERARQERDGRERLELFHQADRMAVADRVALIPIAYGRAMAFVKPWVSGWWEFGKTSSSFADLVVDESSPRFNDGRLRPDGR